MGRFGPFVHGLNKGGLNQIRATGRLIATDAAETAGGSSAVRALVGSFQTLQVRNRWGNQPQKIFIEFTTDIAPAPHPAIAVWYLPDGAFLPITILGTYDGAGHRV